MKLASVFGHVPAQRKLEAWDGWPLPKCNIGLEWEFEQAAMLIKEVLAYPNNPYITIKEDGSLRDGGIELVTTGDGLFGVDLNTAILLVDKWVKQAAPTCTYRTGFHVHIDIRDMEEKELHNMLLLYCLLEKPIFNFVGVDRWKSNFCVPWFRSDSHFPQLKEISTATPSTVNTIGQRIKALARYSALNCQSIAKFGTLEFRHMENVASEITFKQKEFIKIVMLLKKVAQEAFAKGLHGSVFYNSLKDMSSYGLMRFYGYDLPTTGWDYQEALISAVQLVNFNVVAPKTFNDSLFEKFVGIHPYFS